MVKWDELSFNEKLTCMSLFPEHAKQDENDCIRLHAYRALGFPEEAEQDDYEDIKNQAELYFKIKNKLETVTITKKEYEILNEILKKYLGE